LAASCEPTSYKLRAAARGSWNIFPASAVLSNRETQYVLQRLRQEHR